MLISCILEPDNHMMTATNTASTAEDLSWHAYGLSDGSNVCVFSDASIVVRLMICMLQRKGQLSFDLHPRLQSNVGNAYAATFTW